MSTKQFWDSKFSEFKEHSALISANLEYLDLASQAKVTVKDLSHNFQIFCYRQDLGHKVLLAATHKSCKEVTEALQEDNEKLQKDLKANKAAVLLQQQTIQKLVESCDNLHKEITKLKKIPKPLSKEDVEELVVKISEQPKFIERQTEALIEELSSKVNKIEALIHRLEKVLLT
ncbi:ORF1 [Canna yellow mottle associated virus]|uniref:ORF1 n=1 Tax=Canna yellow mottle associated virus TaxID=2560371 RepID=A0A193H3C2_9VIRU|nr:ORF1 [Canna yellow mottle associated virus]ANN87817.1 ORF1 [Canna yellow mottle associated virus]